MNQIKAYYHIEINDININKLVNENFKGHLKYFIEKINKYIYGGYCTYSPERAVSSVSLLANCTASLDDMVITFIVQAHRVFGNTVMIDEGKREEMPASTKFNHNDLKLKYSKIVYRQMFGGKLCPQDWSDGDGSAEPPFSQVLFILACVMKFGLDRLEIGRRIIYRKEYDWNPSIYKIDIIKDTNMISCSKIINEIHQPSKKMYAFDCCGNLVTEKIE
jgi:hypothetical protein